MNFLANQYLNCKIKNQTTIATIVSKLWLSEIRFRIAKKYGKH